MKKSDLPRKICPVCGIAFHMEKKKNGGHIEKLIYKTDDVIYCSEK